jgi:hypothetical protein
MDIRKMWNWFVTRVVDSAVTLILTAALTALVGALVAFWVAGPLSAVAGPAAIMCGAVVFASTMSAYRSIVAHDERKKLRARANPTASQMEELVWSWLRKNRFTLTDAPAEGVEFRISADDPQKLPLFICKPNGMPWLLAVAALTVNPEHQILLRSKVSFRYDVGLALATLGVQFELEEEKAAGVLTMITVKHIIVFDERMGELEFLRELFHVRRAIVAAREIIKREVTLLAPDTAFPAIAGPSDGRALPSPPD